MNWIHLELLNELVLTLLFKTRLLVLACFTNLNNNVISLELCFHQQGIQDEVACKYYLLRMCHMFLKDNPYKLNIKIYKLQFSTHQFSFVNCQEWNIQDELDLEVLVSDSRVVIVFAFG